MPRLIDADKLERKAKFNQQTGNFIELNDLTNTPTVDAEPVIHAHWHEKKRGYPICSNCGADALCMCKSKRCPYCGAKMDEESL